MYYMKSEGERLNLIRITVINCYAAENRRITVNLMMIMFFAGQSRRTTQGHDVRTIRIADPTGSVLMGIWNDVGDCIVPGDIWRLRLLLCKDLQFFLNKFFIK